MGGAGVRFAIPDGLRDSDTGPPPTYLFPVMSLIATAPASSTDAPPDANRIANDGWFPDIDMANVRATVRLDGTVTDERLRAALVDAIVSVNTDLATFQGAQASLGRQSLAEVPAMNVGGESVHLSRYRTAVYRLARASLTERYRDFDSTKSGHQKASELECTIDDDRRDARWAIRDILGVGHYTVELI